MTAPLTGAGTWSEIKGKGWKYLDKGANGVQKVVMKGSAEAGKGAIVLLARGDSVPVPSLPRYPGGFVKDTTGLDRSYDIQLHIDNQTACHGMSYDIGSEPEVHVDKMKGDGVTPVGVWKIKRTGTGP
ncbi:MAG: hypothetical protein JRG83_16170 [Deltaproteobacteria bacterium]|nr:hypothetical protein [Deltaproteobacteria bacterium]